MSIALVQEPKSGISRTGEEATLESIHELLVFCPKCKVLEILWFDNGYLMKTRKFDQTDGQVYHDCGSNQPCRLYRSL